MEAFGNVESQKKHILGSSYSLWRNGGSISRKMIRRERRAVAELKITLLEEISWRQKSQALRLKQGDKCT